MSHNYSGPFLIDWSHTQWKFEVSVETFEWAVWLTNQSLRSESSCGSLNCYALNTNTCIYFHTLTFPYTNCNTPSGQQESWFNLSQVEFGNWGGSEN